jgi:predicted methyltransferase
VKVAFVIAITAVGLCAAPIGNALPGTPVPEYVTAAIADAGRPPSDVSLDAVRRPAQVIAFAGLEPGDRIADFMSGNAYFTRIFSRVVGPQGHVYAFLPTQQLANCSPNETAGTKALSGDGRYRNVTIIRSPTEKFATPESLDLVFTAQNFHDLYDSFMGPSDVAAVNRAVFRTLKPGGVYLVIDHAAAAGSGLRDTETLHRIDPQSIRDAVLAAGFVLEAESNELRNPADSHALPVFDPAVRHRTDQVILKFRKPPAN